MDHGGRELGAGAGAGETIADQRGEEARDGKDLKLVDKVKQLTLKRMLRSKIALTLMTSSIAFLVMIILLTSSLIASPKESFGNQDFGSIGVIGDENRDQNQDFGSNGTVNGGDEWYCLKHLRSIGFYFSCPLESFVGLGASDINENVENQDFGRDINRLDYFRVAPFDPLHGDDSNTSGIANGGGTTYQAEISSNNGSGAGEASTSNMVVSQTFNQESINTVRTPSITVQALEDKLAKYEEERERREQEFQSQLEAERKHRADMEARQQETTAQLAQQLALLEHISAFMRQYLSENPPPPPQ